MGEELHSREKNETEIKEVLNYKPSAVDGKDKVPQSVQSTEVKATDIAVREEKPPVAEDKKGADAKEEVAQPSSTKEILEPEAKSTVSEDTNDSAVDDSKKEPEVKQTEVLPTASVDESSTREVKNKEIKDEEAPMNDDKEKPYT